MNQLIIDIIGYIAGITMLVSFLPQIYVIIINKKANDLSFLFIFLLFIISILYTIYGFFINSLPLTIMNIIAIVLTLFILMLKIYYDNINNNETFFYRKI